MTLRSWMFAALAVALLVLADRGIGVVLGRLADGVERGASVGSVNQGLRQLDTEILVFGSSRAVYHVDPEILERELGRSAYNLGAPGMGIRYARAMQALLLRRGSRAQLMVLHVDPRDLWGGDPERVLRVARFYGEDPAVDALLDSTSPTAPLKLQAHTYRYNSLLPAIVAGWVRGGGGAGDGHLTMPAGRPRDLYARRASEHAPGEILEAMSSLFVDFIEAAREAGVRVALVDGPRFRPDGLAATDRLGHPHLARLAREHGAAWILIDERSDPAFAEPRYWADVTHLTGEGARLFSARLADELRPVLAD